ncbi:DUF3757 domain-containing protein [Citrobacter rodentium]|uniref:Exported protein n=2 Tax=Citrobacter rodentium TaxID=67825 RepID=D2TU74_CITRI|nr:DUF3757 domain-containing protein [Citrobacter rodentium]QBY30168.1 DUF3757 domain-containing protein [Citrobacter rodentium]UHO32454.1 DUF3757 domain-containing protein [Citrobacter rodentium NBRC 105723 = DSM 16636]CBG90540.1 putative exported protein [Citrobacter rodentium ICC168]HAT8014311.1 hypothetical protein [Citrobacter rodentium NBRC 105723 = DSM 16636]HAT8019251.1 hypothetical protein [Citrobacter rodentium]
MKHGIYVAMTLALLSGCASASTESMSCPAPESISYENHIYTSPVTLSGWEGSWNSQAHRQQDIKRFVTALYFAKTGVTEGVLVNCTYELANGQEIDLTYSRKGEEDILSNLIVSIDGNTNWYPESASKSERFYDCDKSADACSFTPLRTVYN